MKRCLLGFAVLLWCVPAFAWGKIGHQAVAEIAGDMLNSPAKIAVDDILGSTAGKEGAALASIANWPDEVRTALHTQKPNSQEATAFVLNFPDNDKWHFTDLPVGASTYNMNGPFSRANDAVHAIQYCITLLEAPQENPKFTRRQALSYLVHLVGDIHQPLHAAEGYFTFDGNGNARLQMNPPAPRGLFSDAGGNALVTATRLTAANGKVIWQRSRDNLHSFWDDEVPKHLAGDHASHKKLIANLKESLTPEAASGFHTAGDYHHWMETWAADSAQQAQAIYAHLTFGPGFKDARHYRDIPVEVPHGFGADQADLATVQLHKAAVHLADLLNAIKWGDAKNNAR